VASVLGERPLPLLKIRGHTSAASDEPDYPERWATEMRTDRAGEKLAVWQIWIRPQSEPHSNSVPAETATDRSSAAVPRAVDLIAAVIDSSIITLAVR
jgi:hypothetical protein